MAVFTLLITAMNIVLAAAASIAVFVMIPIIALIIYGIHQVLK